MDFGRGFDSRRLHQYFLLLLTTYSIRLRHNSLPVPFHFPASLSFNVTYLPDAGGFSARVNLAPIGSAGETSDFDGLFAIQNHVCRAHDQRPSRSTSERFAARSTASRLWNGGLAPATDAAGAQTGKLRKGGLFRHCFGSEGALDQMGSIHPIGRIGRPEEIADTVAWLFSEKSSYYTGQSLTFDGGLTAQRPYITQPVDTEGSKLEEQRLAGKLD
jgi:hypothetical protein